MAQCQVIYLLYQRQQVLALNSDPIGDVFEKYQLKWDASSIIVLTLSSGQPLWTVLANDDLCHLVR